MSSSDEPWADYEPEHDPEVLERLFGDDPEMDVDQQVEDSKKTRWLREDATLEEVVQHEMEHVIDVSHETVAEHGVYLVTDFSAMPSEIVMEDGFGASLDWSMKLKWALDQYTDYKVTNKRMKGGNLVLTLAPDNA